MKKILNKTISGILSAGLLLIAATSCDYLDQKPDNLRTDESIWHSRDDVDKFLNNAYMHIWLPVDDFSVLGVADESSVPYGGTHARKMIEGTWGPSNGVWDYWTECYKALRSAIEFVSKVDRVPSDKMSDELKERYKAEATFLKGWFYWKLLQQYGPFVILEDLPGTDTDYTTFVRSPFEDCVELICDLMDEAATVLPTELPTSAYQGRATKGACLAVKSQVLLLAAGELWNGNPEYADFTNKDGTPLAPLTKDQNKWKIAADAAKKVIELGEYALYSNPDPYLAFRNLFLEWNTEIIFNTNTTIYANYNYAWQWGYDKRCNPMPGGYNMQNATQNIVDAFYTRSGLDKDDDPDYTETGFAIQDDPANYGYAEDGVNRGYHTGTSNMYVDREPRFYASISYNGCPVLSAPTVDDKNYFSSPANVDGRGRAEYYYNGLSGATRLVGDVTGYNMIKKVSPAANVRDDKAVYRPFIHIRYAEILLNYIEALNEYDPDNNDIVYYLGLIRERAGIPNITITYPQDIGDQDAMREWILRERQIELAFEGDRYWTLCRRKLWEQSKYRKVYRMNVNQDDGGQGFAFTDFYTRDAMADRYWHNKMYLHPISQDEMDKGKGLVQNPGWSGQ